jgi:hypothetical protein
MIPLCRNNTKELCPTDKYRKLITAENSKLKVTKGIRKGIVKLSTSTINLLQSKSKTITNRIHKYCIRPPIIRMHQDSFE